MKTYTYNKYIIIKHKIIHRALIFAFIFSWSLLKNNMLEAANKTYIGANNGNWSTATNWSPNGAPASGDNITIDNGNNVNATIAITFTAGSITITSSSLTNTNDITIGGTATLFVSSGSTVSLRRLIQTGGTITNEGSIITNGTTGTNGNLDISGGNFINSGTLTISNNLNLSSTGNFTSTGNINVDKNLNIFTGAVMTLTSGTANFNNNGTMAGTLNIVDATVHLDHSLTISPGGTINATGNYSMSVDVFVVNGTLNANNGSNIPDIIVAGNMSGTGTMRSLGTPAATISYPTNGFGGRLYGTDNLVGTVTLAGNIALPVEFTAFNGQVNGSTVSLKWSTASENNNDYFSIERSTDGIDFEAIGTIDGAGSSNGTLNYIFTDENSLSGTSYYRIKQTDFNSEFKYSKIIAVKTIDETSVTFSNPSDGEIHLIIDVNSIKAVEVYDLRGNSIFYSDYWNTESEGGKSLQEINLTNNAKGMYIIKTIDASSEANSHKIIIQ